MPWSTGDRWVGDGASGAAEWVWITDQWEQSALVDPGEYAGGAGSGVDLGSGEVTFTAGGAGLATDQFDGTSENCPGVSCLLTDLIPDFDTTRDTLLIRMEVSVLPAATHKLGLAACIMDNTLANRAIANGAGMGLYGNTATQWAGGSVGPTSHNATTTGIASRPARGIGRYTFSHETPPSISNRLEAISINGTATPISVLAAVADTMASADIAAWRIWALGTHVSAVSGAGVARAMRVAVARMRAPEIPLV